MVKYYNFDKPDSCFRDDDWVVWWEQPCNKHTWAFIFFCRRVGHKVYVKNEGNKLNVALKRLHKDEKQR